MFHMREVNGRRLRVDYDLGREGKMKRTGPPAEDRMDMRRSRETSNPRERSEAPPKSDERQPEGRTEESSAHKEPERAAAPSTSAKESSPSGGRSRSSSPRRSRSRSPERASPSKRPREEDVSDAAQGVPDEKRPKE